MSSDRHNSRKARPWQPLKRLMQSLFRFLFHITGRRSPQAGFVFPTTLLLVLMLLLTVSALTFRTFTRSSQNIAQRDQQVIYNSATPAVDRAKAKIEFMFQEDPRFPSGVPPSDFLADMMAIKQNAADDFVGFANSRPVPPLDADIEDPYTLPDERRVDINGDGSLDNAWAFPFNENGDPVPGQDLVTYSVLVDDTFFSGDRGSNVPLAEGESISLDAAPDQDKADALVTRTGPLATTEAIPACKGAAAEGGWQVVQNADNSSLQKNFQVDVFVADANAATDTFETLEFQQSRIAARSNKWGAWFRYDLEIFPGSDFNWNGAMHTDGSISLHAEVEPHMVSSHNSCLYSKRSSEITLGEFDNNDDGAINVADGDFQGQAIKGYVEEDSYTNRSLKIHLWDQNDNTKPLTNGTSDFDQNNDSVTGGRPSQIAMNPLKLFTEDIAEHTDADTWARDDDWNEEDSEFVKRGRIYNDNVSRPFVDDFYRADNRWGPKPRYDSRDSSLDLINNEDAGEPIVAKSKLTDPEEGLDGYWERQAITKGLRLIVGQRLELGNVNGWNNDPSGASPNPEDPLYPAAQKAETGGLGANSRFGGNHEYLQRKKLRDNLAAVQSLVVYHYQGAGMASDGSFPAACMAMTAHPGTLDTIVKSRTFENYENNTSVLKTDFLRGQGTNGWEFKYNDAFDTPGEFASQVVATAPLGKALRNLAYFAGDPNGGAPSFTPVQDSFVHPYPYQSMWGDFSMLRRIIDGGGLDTAADYGALSPADKATVHSAACTLSMLAYNVQEDIAEAETILDNPPESMQSVSQQLGGTIGDIATCLDGSDPNNTGGGGNPCGGTGSFDLVGFLEARGDLDATSGDTTWTDPDPDTVITEDNLCPVNGGSADDNGFQANCDSAEYFATWTLDDWIDLIQSPGVVPSLDTADDDSDGIANDIETLIDFSVNVNYYSSLIRDRDLGFREGTGPNSLPYDPSAGSFVSWDSSTGLVAPVDGFLGGNRQLVFNTGCDPNIFQSLAAGGGGGDENNVTAGLVACSEIDEYPIKFPSLYYLFPLVNHDHDGEGYHQQPDNNLPSLGGGLDPTVQAAEEYVADSYITSENASVTYQVVRAGATDDPVKGISSIAASPKPTDFTDWTLPTSAGTAITTTNVEDNPFSINVGTTPTGRNVTFLDKGIANGRQQMGIRVLDIDVDKLVSNRAGTDYWLSADLDAQAEGIVYAYREDAVREDEIVRPANASVDADACQAPSASGYPFAIETDADCQMNAAPGEEQDPPLTDINISLKPVDFAPDPMRSPDGFRFQASGNDPVDFSGPNLDRQVGMTFVTDNAVYIQGDFNLHSTDGTPNNIVEEFTETLLDGSVGYRDPFYNDRETLDLDNFANLNVDHWRPVEILADEINILSENFNDGAIVDAFTKPRPGSDGGADSSYMNLYRPRFTGTRDPDFYVLENPDDVTSPIYIDRNGTFYVASTGNAFYSDPAFDNSNEWVAREDENSNGAARNLQSAPDETYVNAVFVSGIVPQRPEQSYGGLHNFPRFNEFWGGDDLFIQGSFIQLNFSTAGTAPFDHDSWEPGEATRPDNTGEWIGYYRNPNRNWGFDVGLLYVPPAPAARRFVSIGVPRNEYYREIAGDDPYIRNLRCAEYSPNDPVFPNLCNKP